MADEANDEVELPAPDGEDVPPIDFTTFILSLSTSALAHLGEARHPDAEGQVNLGLARQSIDLLQLIEEKTEGNLDGEEERLLTQVLSDLKLRYVAKAKK